jgi:hypothetical protein
MHEDTPDAVEGAPPEQEEELPELDLMDPLKRDPDESPGGLDPVLPAPPPE